MNRARNIRAISEFYRFYSWVSFSILAFTQAGIALTLGQESDAFRLVTSALVATVAVRLGMGLERYRQAGPEGNPTD